MGQLGPLISGRVVAFDTALLIYYPEEHLTYLPLVDELFDAVDAGHANGITGVLTLLEVLIKPLRDGRLSHNEGGFVRYLHLGTFSEQ
jgi:hypothetical protein